MLATFAFKYLHEQANDALKRDHSPILNIFDLKTWLLAKTDCNLLKAVTCVASRRFLLSDNDLREGPGRNGDARTDFGIGRTALDPLYTV